MNEKKPISALVLDFGGVISRPWDPSAAGTRLQALQRRYEDFYEIYSRHRGAYDQGRMDAEAYWRAVLGHYGIEATAGEIPFLVEEDIRSWVQPNPQMRAFVEERHDAFSKRAILSNMNVEVLAFVRRQYDWLDLFDERIYSCEVGCVKPGREIFDLCVSRLGLAPETCLFVDDAQCNTEAARAAGLSSIHYRDHDRFLAEFEREYRPVADR